MGLEAASLRRWSYSRGKWRQIDFVVADDEETAERRFFDRWTEHGLSGLTPASRRPARLPAPRRCRLRRMASSACFPNPGDAGDGRHHRLRLRQSALGRQGVRARRRASLAQPEPVLVTRDPERVWRADRIVLPGVGAFADCSKGLDAVDGMVQALNEVVRDKARPFFGICVGMQLMAERGREYVVTEGLGWIAGDVEKIEPQDDELKIPHMGWNTLDPLREHPLLDGMPLGDKGLHAYFVHSYHLKAANEADVVARPTTAGR